MSNNFSLPAPARFSPVEAKSNQIDLDLTLARDEGGLYEIAKQTIVNLAGNWTSASNC